MSDIGLDSSLHEHKHHNDLSNFFCQHIRNQEEYRYALSCEKKKKKKKAEAQ